ncbi:hypothetical protein C1H76_5518 [Elsinoe australis]|uniref:Uncharacterized protein n=1 Tax=Elsinoe australis TaxID=40998 RepID=A0A4U7AVP8_9PEZI|nr:hypothetical protein C1H76_5518 [Elsinoe australis]
MLSHALLLTFAAGSLAALSDSSLKTFPNSLQLTSEFNPVKEAYWTSRPKHRRTPFAVSPDGTKAWVAYLDNSESGVHIQQVDPSTFAAVGSTVTIANASEAGGLVAHNDGFAVLANSAATGVSPAPPGGTPIAKLHRFTTGATEPKWTAALGGPAVTAGQGIKQDNGALSMSPDMNGDLVYSEAAGMYGSYVVVTDYAGWAQGHFGDSLQYIDNDGKIQTTAAGASGWGCSHNTGIAIEAADAMPFASLCAEDQGAIWLNTGGKGMDGVKVSNEHTINGASGEPMGGMSGSYSSLARFQGAGSYIFAWVSRGSSLLTADSWRGAGYTKSNNRTEYRRVAIATFSDKNTLDGPEAISTVGATNGDSQINWVSDGPADASNARVATFDGTNALVSWDQIDSPSCTDDAMDCAGTYTGTRYQLISSGKKAGTPITSQVFVSGDQVTMKDGRICWPYVDMKWSLSGPVGRYSGTPATTVKALSFACMSNGDAPASPAPAPSSSAAPAPSSSAAPVPSSSAAPPSSSAPAPAPSSTADPVPTEEAPAPAPTSSTADPVPTEAAPSPSASDVEPVPTETAAEPTPTGYDSPPFNPSPSSSAPVDLPGAGNTPTAIYPTSSAAATANPVPTAEPSAPSASACQVEWVTVYV